jgi:septal ring-binding cell division protein DamX
MMPSLTTISNNNYSETTLADRVINLSRHKSASNLTRNKSKLIDLNLQIDQAASQISLNIPHMDSNPNFGHNKTLPTD